MAGYWTGTAINRGSGRRYQAVALIQAQGQAQFLLLRRDEGDDDEEATFGFVLYGNVCCDARFNADLAAKLLRDTRGRTARIDAELSSGILSGEFEFRRDDYRFTLNASSGYDRALTMQSLAGVYTRRSTTVLGEEVTLALTIGADGQLTGSYSNGCVINGNASIPHRTLSLVQLQIELANCGGAGSSERWNGPYTGSGVVLPGGVLYHSAVGPTWLGPQSVAR